MEKVTYAGWDDCLRLHNEHVELITSVGFGPRILHYGFHGGPNVFALCPDLGMTVPGGTWKPYGGHRLWTAPEVMPRSYFPDNDPVGTIEMRDGTLHLSNPPESTTGIQKTLQITLAPDSSAVRVVHRLTNHGAWAVTVSAWALSIVANGGRVVLPQEPFASHDDDLLPARPLVLWKFTDMADPRWRWGEKYLSLRQDDAPAGKPQKVGLFNTLGWAAHLTPQQAFIVHSPVAGSGPASLPDYGSSFETYTDGPFQELETLSPLQTLEPGESLDHVEEWFLAASSPIDETDAALDTYLLPLVAQARAAAASST